MMRNDYRRALILLRSNAEGYSGHVRLERRTLMGTMYFMVQAPQDCPEMRAALVGRGRDGYYACNVGAMQRDSRGQAVLSYSFDPRNICGHELEEYRLIVLSCAGDGGCEILLHGNVNGHTELDWDRVRAALCALDSGGEAKDLQILPGAEEDAAAPTVSDALEREIREEIREELREEQEDVLEDILENDPERQQTAGEVLGIGMERPWPESIEPLRALFRVSVPMENPPDDEYVYIAAAMPEESGYAYSAVGIRVQDGMPVSVRYGLPAPWSAEAPAGLEEYTWVGNSNYGWWMTQVDLTQPS